MASQKTAKSTLVSDLPDSFFCPDCGKIKPVNKSGTGGIGYGIFTTKDGSEQWICYDCAGIRDIYDMLTHARHSLYLEEHKNGSRVFYTLTNWPNTVSFQATRYSRSRDSFGGLRIDVWFSDGYGNNWHGVCRGADFNQYTNCEKLKKR
jgi:hypothetical protein